MYGLMQEHPLLISSLIRHAARHHGSREIVSREASGELLRTCYADVERRARALSGALAHAGVAAGDRVATLGCSTHRHLECFYGVSGMGAVLHTVNPRLSLEQLAYIINHAEDRVLLFDPGYLALVEGLAPQLRSIEHYVVLEDLPHMVRSERLSLLCYEAFLRSGPAPYEWPLLDERSASSLCYTSGTTGHPKGVLYSHRSTVIHALVALQADCFGLRATDVVMPIVPMFHANAWSLPYGCAMTGAKLVLPGAMLDVASLHALIVGESVTFAAGVPTIWSTVLAYLREHALQVPTLERVLVGGAALAPAVHAGLHACGVRALHAWGMTETSPIGTIASHTAATASLPQEAAAAQLLKQGRVPWGIDIRVSDPERGPLPQDGHESGALWVRGPWVASGYFKSHQRVLDAEGWFPTGDIASWDEYGFIKITDRAKDVIKSGGEWISSLELENQAMSHSKVRLAAAIGVAHPKWDERPILIVVPHAGEHPSREEILEFLRPRIVKWWLPDDVVFVSELPLTATGKIIKSQLRERYRDHLLRACAKPISEA